MQGPWNVLIPSVCRMNRMLYKNGLLPRRWMRAAAWASRPGLMAGSMRNTA